ncbi:peptidoglycan-binding lysin domain-containing protein [Gordonia neofelifaecis NRRL B-59395]|uniref:Peptidoglycan-binding lysin domain-containing protein n=1 Tax=Gordonia neofelifaecis NRRL B-59395 TaxID=644548 RepID=F1YMT4_9ACTN|nr:peptidoglycan-binding lysin domain-containing protein [Gordonia neofelifaecis NRRL B-59395]
MRRSVRVDRSNYVDTVRVFEAENERTASEAFTAAQVFDTAKAQRRSLVAPESVAVYRRRRWVGALVGGGVLAGMVWLLAIVGAGYQDAATPATPGATQVVYVRSGESLSALAERIAPSLPTDGVIAQLRELNGLETSGLHVGQAIIAPQYG